MTVQWRLLLNGSPVSDAASVIGLTSSPCGGDARDPVVSPGRSELQYLDVGSWQANWKTDKGYAGSCRTLMLSLDDGLGDHSVDVQFE